MTMTGASRKLDELLKHFQSHMTNLQEDILPKIRDFQRQEKLFKQIKETMSEDQKQQLQKSGYAKMSDKQLELVYNDKGKKCILKFI
jgi:Skp family chaperone for outer membrane proteins